MASFLVFQSAPSARRHSELRRPFIPDCTDDFQAATAFANVDPGTITPIRVPQRASYLLYPHSALCFMVAAFLFLFVTIVFSCFYISIVFLHSSSDEFVLHIYCIFIHLPVVFPVRVLTLSSLYSLNTIRTDFLTFNFMPKFSASCAQILARHCT